MTDYQRLIDNIRHLLQSANAATSDRVEGVATEYVIACSDVNDRLRKCGELLRQGLRSEAIEVAEAEPNLLTLVALLDFPELAEWQQLMRSNRVLVAESPLIDIAAELNEAYALEQPVAVLLKRHRLLALARSPLRERLATLKHLARIDHANPVWQDDVRIYEKARHQEIHRAAESEYKNGNVVALEEMATDLESTDWLENPPTALATQVTKSLAKLRREKASAELKVLEPQLNEAFGQLDVETARAVRTQWRSAMAIVDLADDDPLVERAAPALEWLEHQDREQSQETGFASAIAALENAIDEDAGADKLERLAHAALRYDRPLPTLLEQRYRSRVAGLELAGTRRIRLIAAVASVLILSVAASIGYTMYRQGQATLVATHVDTLRRFMDQQLYDDADKHLLQLAENQPAVVGDARVQFIKVELANLQRAEKQRRTDFESAIERAERSATTTPDRAALGMAGKLARTDEEKTQVLRLQASIAEFDRLQQGKLDREFLQNLAALSARVNGLHAGSSDLVVQSLSTELRSLMEESHGVSKSVEQQAKPLQAKLASIENSKSIRRAMDVHLDRLTTSVGRVDAYKKELELFSTQFRDTARANIFKRVSLESELWRQVDDWNEYIQRWNAAGVASVSAEAARLLNKDGEAILKEHGSYPVAKALRGKASHLNAIGRRESESGEKLQASLNELFTDPLVVGLWMIEEKTDEGETRRYYLTERPSINQSGNTLLRCIIDFNRKIESRNAKLSKVTYNGRAPQSLVAKEALDKLVSIKNGEWEKQFFAVIHRIQEDDKLEPVLKVLFLQQVVDVGGQGSESLRTAFAQSKELLSTVPIDTAAPWMDPENEDANRARALAADLIARLPDLRKVGEAAATERRTFIAPLRPTFRWFGWLARNNDSEFQCRRPSNDPASGKLYTLQLSGDGETVDCVQIGQVQDGTVLLESHLASAGVEGRPIYIVDADQADSRQ